MVCPHCHNKIPNGSNICPLCYSNLSGVSSVDEGDAPAARPAPKKTGTKSSGSKKYTKGSRGPKKKKNPAPTIIAVGIILILLVVIALIVRSMFGLSTPMAAPTPTPTVRESDLSSSFFQPTAVSTTSTPDISITPTPNPDPTPAPEVSYKTLKKGDQGPDVVRLQQALAELGYLTTAADGIYGTGTMTAVKSFQSANGLDSDGIAGKQTQALLFDMTSIEPLERATAAPGDILDLPG